VPIAECRLLAGPFPSFAARIEKTPVGRLYELSHYDVTSLTDALSTESYGASLARIWRRDEFARRWNRPSTGWCAKACLVIRITTGGDH
jgi:hypothetical protein